MPNHPAPTIAADLGLVTQKLVNTEVGHVCEVTFALSLTAAGGSQDAIDDFQANFNANIVPEMANTVTAEKPTMLVGDGTNVPGFVTAAGAVATGSVNNDYPPPNCALLVKKTSALAGKKNRGRTYFPFMVTEAQTLNNGSITGARVTALQTVMSAFLTQLSTDLESMFIANKTLVLSPGDKHPHVTAITFGPEVLSYTVEPFMATQRRRLVRS